MTEILILGAGYTGMAAIAGLVGRLKGREDVHLTLVNPQTRFTERLRLHQTASGQDLADLQIPDQLEGTGVDFVRGWVTGIDADARTVRVDDAYTLRYDTLIYALGSVADTETVPGVDEFAYTLNSAQDATLLADHLNQLADGPVVVAGGGLTGVESAAEIAEQHPELDVVLLSRQVPGSMMGDKARARLHAGLERLGRLETDRRIAGDHRLEAVRAHLLEMAGQHQAARAAYQAAAQRTMSLPHQRYLNARATRLSGHR